MRDTEGRAGGSLDELVLASTSPQRSAILGQLGIPFRVATPAYVEHDRPGATVRQLAREHARGKAHSIDRGRHELVLGVDTIVEVDRDPLGKPDSRDAAREMLRRLAARTHAVVSGLCLTGERCDRLVDVTTRVSFGQIDDDELERYLETDEWQGRAGAYAIQGRGARFVTSIDGDYLNVVGLPGAALLELLRECAPDLLVT